MSRKPEIGNIQLYPNRPLRASDKNGYVLKFYCPIRYQRVRKNCGTRDQREARKIQRECQKRLLNGEYVASDGAIAEQRVTASSRKAIVPHVADTNRGKSWDEAYERYRQHRSSRVRATSLTHALSRLQLAERIFLDYIQEQGSSEGLYLRDCCNLGMLEYLQERLLAGDECRYDHRSPNTVNSMLGAVMAFVRFCHAHEWIDRVPRLQKLDVDDVMKGRPITTEEFERLLVATPQVVGQGRAESWVFTLRVLWETGFRIGDVMDFSWDDDRHIHPVWPERQAQHPTLVVPSTQKNGVHQEIPMLPGLGDLLLSVAATDRMGWVVNPQPVEYLLRMPGNRRSPVIASRSKERLTKERVSRVIGRIGKESGVVVRPEDERTRSRVKYASAHDLRRGCALRLINAGVSAETLMVVMRHADFATTQKFYGAMRSAQSAAAEVREKLSAGQAHSLVGGLVGGLEPATHLSEVEVSKLRSLLASL
ncbi:MAG: site-specific integrase [Planctomycetota bacterium]